MRSGLVSIIIPCYNGEEYLKRLFDSLLKQTYRNLQIIFVNDGSTDNTMALVEEYAEKFKQNNIELIKLVQDNRGQASAVNMGLPYVSGEYFMWIDCDDFLEKNHVQKKLEYLEEHKELNTVMCQGNIYDECDLTRIIGVLGGEIPVGTLFQDILFSFRSCQCGLYMIRTQALFDALPEKRIYESQVGQNMQILLPVTFHNKVGYMPDKLYNYVVRAESHSHSFRGGIQWKQRLDNLEDMKKHILKEMQISENFRNKMLRRLSFQMNAMRMNKIDKLIIGYDRAYVEEVLELFFKYSETKEHLRDRRIYIWGMGEAALGMIAALEKIAHLTVEGIVESKQENEGKIWNDKPVIVRDEIDKETMYILIPLKAHKDIWEFLAYKGFECRCDFFYPEYELRNAVEEDEYECV